MGGGALPIIRIPLILLVIADFTILGVRLWPWQDVLNLPGNGVVALDPVICLLAYIGLIFLIAGSREELTRKALVTATLLGLLAAVFMVFEIVLKTQAANADSTLPSLWRKGLLGAAILVWGVAGLLGARTAGSGGIGMLSGLWSAMVSCLINSTAVLTLMFFVGPPPLSQDPWKQYEGLAIGNPATQGLVNSLNIATFFLLVGPLVGGAIALIFCLFGKAEKS